MKYNSIRPRRPTFSSWPAISLLILQFIPSRLTALNNKCQLNGNEELRGGDVQSVWQIHLISQINLPSLCRTIIPRWNYAKIRRSLELRNGGTFVIIVLNLGSEGRPDWTVSLFPSLTLFNFICTERDHDDGMR